MIKINDIIKASEGKLLVSPIGISTEVTLGTTKLIENGKVVEINIEESSVKEVTPVRIGEDIIYLESTDYSNAVSELIRFKYSLDAELALVANSRLGNYSGEEEFQNWRRLCKETAKKLFNE